ncbi:MAG: hypothetical protein K1X79_09135 [Oligoflexia bacterium]|nr:hypothetical protein [Oligoflexia bacterium]
MSTSPAPSSAISLWTSISKTEFQMSLARVSDRDLPALLGEAERFGPLATRDPELRDFSLALAGYNRAAGVAATASTQEKLAFCIAALTRVKNEEPVALLVEGPTRSYYYKQQRNDDGTISGGANPFLSSGLVISREIVKMPYSASQAFTLALPLMELVDGTAEEDWSIRAIRGVVHPHPSTDPSSASAKVIAADRDTGAETIQLAISALEEFPPGVKGINILSKAATTALTLLELRDKSAALERLVARHGFEDTPFEIKADVAKSLSALEINPDHLRFVRHTETGLVIGMLRIGTAMYVHLPAEKFHHPLVGAEMASIFPALERATHTLSGGTPLQRDFADEGESIMLGDVLIKGFSPRHFDTVIASMLTGTSNVIENHARIATEEALAEATRATQAALAADRAAAVERLIVQAETKVRELAAQVLGEMDKTEQLLQAALGPVNITPRAGTFYDYLGARSTPFTHALWLNIAGSDAELLAAQRRVLSEEVMESIQKQRANTRVYDFAHRESGLKITIAAVRTDLVSPRVRYEAYFERVDGQRLGPADFEKLGTLPASSVTVDGYPAERLGTRTRPAQRVAMILREPADLVRFLAGRSPNTR